MFPDDRLLIVFDIDGTILDLRHMVRHVLLDYDRTNATAHFRGLAVDDIDVHEEKVADLLERFPMDSGERRRIVKFYEERCWKPDAILASHRPYRGVMEVIRWFQLQPNTDVAINTGRPEALRGDTLRSLNALGRVCRVSFASELMAMHCERPEISIAQAKADAIAGFRAQGYRVVAVIDNEPLNIETMAQADTDGDILFLHADTLFLSKKRKMPRTVSGSDYDLTRLLGEAGLPERVQFVWHGIEDRQSLDAFLGCPLRWCEADIRTDPYGSLVVRPDSYEDVSWRRDELPLRFDEFVGRMLAAGKSMKLDLEGGEKYLDRVLGVLCMQGIPSERLWFNANVEDISESGFRLIRTVYPGAAVQCPVDFLAPLMRSLPARAEETLEDLFNWGIDRFSIGWTTQKSHNIASWVEELGYAVNIYDVPDLRAFLEAAVLMPRSMTSRFGDSDVQALAGEVVRLTDSRLARQSA
jgi:hypothetical protein